MNGLFDTCILIDYINGIPEARDALDARRIPPCTPWNPTRLFLQAQLPPPILSELPSHPPAARAAQQRIAQGLGARRFPASLVQRRAQPRQPVRVGRNSRYSGVFRRMDGVRIRRNTRVRYSALRPCLTAPFPFSPGIQCDAALWPELARAGPKSAYNNANGKSVA